MTLSIVIFIAIASFFSYYALTDGHFDVSPLVAANILWGYGGAGLFFSILVTCQLFLPKDSEWIFLERQMNMIAEIKKENAYKIYAFGGLTFITTSLLLAFSSYSVFKNYKETQLKRHGIVYLAEIADTAKGEKGVRLAIVNYTYREVVYSKEFESGNYKLHDSLRIVFSDKNPKIADIADR